MKNKMIYTISTSLLKTKNKPENQSIIDYFKNINTFYNVIFRRVWHYLLKIGIKEFKANKSKINSLLILKYKISARTADAIINDILTKFEAIKELKKYELFNLKNKIKK